MTFGTGHHLHLIDGSSFIFRAYHALPPLTRKSDGLPVGAVSGFCNMLLRYIEGRSGVDTPTHVAVIFDHSSKTFRNDLYPDYKANRPPPPEDMIPQFPLTRTACEAFNIFYKDMPGYEADDIIATLANQARAAGGRCTIISSDKDLMQLIGNGVVMLDTMRNRRYDREKVFEKFGVYPERMIDLQALAGDQGDNIPGAPGIGIKIGAMLLNEFGDLNALLDNADTIKQTKRRETLINYADQIRMSQKLVTLVPDLDLDFTLDDLELSPPDPQKLVQFLAEMELRTLTRRVAEQVGVTPPAITEAHEKTEEPAQPDFPPIDPDQYHTIQDETALQAMIDQAYARGYVAVDTETTGLNEMQAGLVGVCLCVEPGQAAYLPLAHRSVKKDLFEEDTPVTGQMNFERALEMLKPMLEDETILKIGQNMKYDAKILARYGINIGPFDDTMLLSYALGAGLHGHGMDALSERFLQHVPIPIKTLLGSGRNAITFDQVPVEEATKYAAEDADITLRLWKTLKPQLAGQKVTTIYETLERPMINVLKTMEMHGIKVDQLTLSQMSDKFAQSMKVLEAEIHDAADEEFNVGSPKQLGEILFDKLGLPGGKRGKTGAYGTGVDVLEDLSTEHTLPALVLDWRQMAKLKSTYTDALQDHIDPQTGRVHTSYSIAGANTGRLASTEPNLQNIPVRTEEGRRIRQAFVADQGCKLVSLDYSQIELRILAQMADIDALKDAFADGIDIHALTASQMFNVPMGEMTSDIRRRAKAINFGVIYGISGYGLARNLRIPRAEAQAFIDTYFERFPGIRTYMDDTVKFAKDHKYVQTLFGRKIHTPDISAKGPHAGFSRRAAINAPIQGTAADVIRRAMIRMPDAIAGLPAKMLLQVHDELLFEVEEGAVDELITTARGVMENATLPLIKLDVPLTVDAGVGDNWAEAH